VKEVGMAKLFRVILPVTDIEAATRFYATLLDQRGERVSSGRHYFDCGGVILACYDPIADTDPAPRPPNPDNVYLSVDDLEAAHARAEAAGCSALLEIKTQPWGERSFYLRDPFGNPVCFVAAGTEYVGGAWG
jgi:catechol 2,3-dioxygenase-like lactoylglutathione lyase family enzyme